MSSCDTGNMSSCDTRRHVFLWHKQNEFSSCDTGRHVVMWHKRTCLLVTLVSQEDMSSCVTKKTCFIVQQEGALEKNISDIQKRVSCKKLISSDAFLRAQLMEGKQLLPNGPELLLALQEDIMQFQFISYS